MTVRSSAVSDYRYNEPAGRYVGSDGRFVSSREIRAEMERVIDGTKSEIKALGKALSEGNITIGGFQTLMVEQVQTLHVMSTAAARGGWAQLEPADLARTAEKIDKQLTFLQGMAVEIETGKQAVSGIERRAGLYAEAGRNTYEGERRLVEGEQGSQEVQNVLGSADHCPGCLEATAMGWVPLEDMTLPGERECGNNCHCELNYR